MNNFSNEPLPEKTVNWPYMLIAVLLVLLAIAGTVIYYQKQTTPAPDQTEQTADDKQNSPAEDIKATTTNGQILDNGETQITTSSGGAATTSPEDTDVQVNLPKPGQITQPKIPGSGVPIGGIKAPQPKATVYVYLYNDYLTPKILEIATNTKVTWKNVQWVSHLLVDRAGDFNSVYSIDADEEYSYTFTKPGTHVYFDYYNRAVTGTIIVK